MKNLLLYSLFRYLFCPRDIASAIHLILNFNKATVMKPTLDSDYENFIKKTVQVPCDFSFILSSQCFSFLFTLLVLTWCKNHVN